MMEKFIQERLSGKQQKNQKLKTVNRKTYPKSNSAKSGIRILKLDSVDDANTPSPLKPMNNQRTTELVPIAKGKTEQAIAIQEADESSLEDELSEEENGQQNQNFDIGDIMNRGK